LGYAEVGRQQNIIGISDFGARTMLTVLQIMRNKCLPETDPDPEKKRKLRKLYAGVLVV